VANIYVPIVASYPNYDNVIKNAERCEELGHSVTLYRALKRKPYKRLSKFMFGVPWGDPELRAKSVIEKVPAAPCIIAAPTGGVGTVRTVTRITEFESWDFAKNKICVGWSDATAIVNKVAAISSYPSFHGPCFSDPQFIDVLPYYTFSKIGWQIPFVLRDNIGKEEILNGISWGGNLTIFNYMLPDPDVMRGMRQSKIIFFFEAVFDEMYGKKPMTQSLLEMELDRLEQRGIFRNSLLILMGRVTGLTPERVVQSIRKYYWGPVVGVDIGHRQKLGKTAKPSCAVPPIPIGTNVRISLKGKYLSCNWSAPNF
jgi:muramoyltetrapeptide carboxypeptidase LdcA involved in peptidoglycan recycling